MMETFAVNRPPKITWHRLNMNETDVEIADLPKADPSAITYSAPSGIRVYDITEDGAATGASADPMGFEHAALSIDTGHAWETGLGKQAEAWILDGSVRHLVFEIPRDTTLPDPVVIRLLATPGATMAATIDLIAGPGSHAKVIVERDSPTLGTGVLASLVRVVAESGSHLEIEQLQTLDEGWQSLDDLGMLLADDARVEVSQMLLGAGQTYLGLATDLLGDRSSCEVDTSYLGHGAQRIDLNYVMRQRGRKTNARLVANGVLTGTSDKTLRGTIDLVHGCKGSRGRETENVLLADREVRNRTLPVILCDEDDVSGDHGATIGHVDRKQLEYMATRGLTSDQVEALFLAATFDRALEQAYDTHSKAAVSRLATSVLGKELL